MSNKVVKLIMVTENNDVNEKLTTIFGDNEMGKTTLINANLWLLTEVLDSRGV